MKCKYIFVDHWPLDPINEKSALVKFPLPPNYIHAFTYAIATVHWQNVNSSLSIKNFISRWFILYCYISAPMTQLRTWLRPEATCILSGPAGDWCEEMTMGITIPKRESRGLYNCEAGIFSENYINTIAVDGLGPCAARTSPSTVRLCRIYRSLSAMKTDLNSLQHFSFSGGNDRKCICI